MGDGVEKWSSCRRHTGALFHTAVDSINVALLEMNYNL